MGDELRRAPGKTTKRQNMKLSAFKFRSSSRDRVTDRRAEFALRWQDYQRGNSPRQMRLRRQREELLASYHKHASSLAGVAVLILIIIALAFA